MSGILLLVFLLYGLAFFAIGLAVAVESRRGSALAFGHHIRWLAGFGLVQSVVVWSEMLDALPPTEAWHQSFSIVHAFLLPVSAILLVRFGIGLVEDAGPSLPGWLEFAPAVLLVPGGLLFAYAIIIVLSTPPVSMAAEVWSRYLLYAPGCILTGIGFIYQWSALQRLGLKRARRWLLAAAAVFFINALVAGLIVPPAPYGLAPWLNSDVVQTLTGVPVQVWRLGIATAMAIAVLRALDIFQAEREQQLKVLQAEHERAQAASLAAQREARENADHWIDTLVNINQKISELDDVDAILIQIVRHARVLLRADAATLGLWNADRTQLLVKAYATPDRVESGLQIPARWEGLKRAANNEDKVAVPVTPDLSTPLRCPLMDRDIHAMAIMPLRIESESLGALWITRLEKKPFDPVELLGLTRLASQAVITIEHALMAERLQSLAVTEERGRIAREMHDGLAQILGFLSLEMQTLQALVRQGNQSALLTELSQARDRINEAQSDVRENILSLRTTLGESDGLIPALEQYLEEFGVLTNIPVRLANELTGEPRLAPLAETQLVRIIQEALANVRKHAHAQQVVVRLARLDGHLGVTIEDDGMGIREEAGRYHFGLETMRERAASVGGSLAIHSQAGCGTRIEVELPLIDRG